MWQPIETAPKVENQPVMLGWVARSCQFGYWRDGHWFVSNNGDYTKDGYGMDYQCGAGKAFPEPTHWMHEPTPPRD